MEAEAGLLNSKEGTVGPHNGPECWVSGQDAQQKGSICLGPFIMAFLK